MVSIIYPNFKIKYKGGGFRFDTISIKRGQCHAQCNYDNVHLYNNSIYIVLNKCTYMSKYIFYHSCYFKFKVFFKLNKLFNIIMYI